MKPLVTQLWPQFTADETFANNFAGVLVERVELLRSQKKVCISLYSARPLDEALCGRLCASLQPVFSGLEVGVQNYYPFEAITPQAIQTLIGELRQSGLPVNGFLDRAQILWQDGAVVLQIPTGKQILESIEFPRRLTELIGQRTGTSPEVRLQTGKPIAQEEWEARIQKKVPAPVFEAKKPAQAKRTGAKKKAA